MNIINVFFEYLGLLLILLNAFLYTLSYKNNKTSMSFKLILFYILFSVLINIAVFTLAAYKLHNLYLSHYYFIIQFIVLSLFYRTLFNTRQKLIVTLLFIPVFIILTIQYTLQPELYFKFNTTEVFITCFPIVVYAMIHLYNSLNKPLKYMYLNAGILIYLTSSTLIFILGDYLSGSGTSVTKNIWFINKVLYVTYLLLILTEWWKNFRVIKYK